MKQAIVITSISPPNKAMRSFADGAAKNDMDFWVIGDLSSPKHFDLPGCRFVSLENQLQSEFEFAKSCPTRHYARKNIGYLLAMKSGAELIIDTDDDNLPFDSFWNARKPFTKAPYIGDSGWCNVYRYFTDKIIWPRGLPLEFIKQNPIDIEKLTISEIFCPIHQGLANSNPDVDAIFRLAFELPFDFQNPDLQIIIGGSALCPFNSQNTRWFKEAFPLLYLPSYCSFRMTDIWRSFVAKRICAENNWGIVFHGATVWQERNEHNLMRDFEDEISGYLNNANIATTLNNLKLFPGISNISSNLLECYSALASNGLIPSKEVDLLKLWINDLKNVIN